MSSYKSARKAIVTVNQYISSVYAIEEGEHECKVLGLFQITEDNNHAEPVFVCEFTDGRIINMYTEYVRFV